ncbi:MAG: sulfurtransferase TusA family protein [Gammaproteobacteria bacterium]|nr:sulfurtransferase TusA family protein [Gammaproteobacteria bacterium]
MSHHRLNVRGLLCPLPVIRTQNRVVELAPGDTLEIAATDPGALHDIPAWCRVHGHEVVSTAREKNEIRVVVRVMAAT